MNLREAMVNYEKVERELREFGARDTEPRSYFEQLICNALRGETVEVSDRPGVWEIYCSMPGAGLAARKLARAARKVFDAIGESKVQEMDQVIGVLNEFVCYADLEPWRPRTGNRR